jgi:hypothetical protein
MRGWTYSTHGKFERPEEKREKLVGYRRRWAHTIKASYGLDSCGSGCG